MAGERCGSRGAGRDEFGGVAAHVRSIGQGIWRTHSPVGAWLSERLSS